MPTENNVNEKDSTRNKEMNPENTSSEATPDQSEAAFRNWNTRQALDQSNLGTAYDNNDTATNDGANIETLDTAFHDKPGYAEGQTVAGSNRADYYESRDNGLSDVEEELEVLKRKQQQQ